MLHLALAVEQFAFFAAELDAGGGEVLAGLVEDAGGDMVALADTCAALLLCI